MFDINQITAWYWLLTIVVVGMCLIATAIHKTISPLIFAGLFGFVLVFFAGYLEPAIFGWIDATDWVIKGVSFVFMAVWFILIGLFLYNSIRYGEVVK